MNCFRWFGFKSLDEVDRLTPKEYMMLCEAEKLKQLDRKAELSLNAWLSFVATATKKVGKSFKPVYPTFDSFFDYAKETGAKVLVYRFPNLFGKWCRPNYNSAVATFCNNIANDLPITVNDPSVMMTLVYVDDVVRCLIDTMDGLALADRSARPICRVYPVHETTLGFLAETISSFAENRTKLGVADMANPLVSALYSTWLSYLPTDKFSYGLKMNCDARGSFTEFLRTANAGQVSVNISRPGIVKGNHGKKNIGKRALRLVLTDNHKRCRGCGCRCDCAHNNSGSL